LAKLKVLVLDHNPYSPDLTPSDYFLFPKLKMEFKEIIFPTLKHLKKL